jgi:probable F420-dependent oxidoreductase
MKVGLPLLVPGEALAGVADAARAAEDAGLDSVSFSEMASDPILHLTVAAGATERVDLVSNIVVAFARSPMTLAVQGRALQEYSRGRLILGLGSQIRPHIERRFSMPWSAPAARMIEYVSALRAIWSAWVTGERLNFRGDFYQHTLMTPMFTPPSTYPAPPVFLAAVGARMTMAAGAVADGLLVHPFSTPRYLRDVTLPAIVRGASAAASDGTAAASDGTAVASDGTAVADGASTSDGGGIRLAIGRPFQVVASTLVISGRTDAEFAESRKRVAEQLAFYGSTPAYRPVLEAHGWGDLGDELNRLSKQADPDRWQQMGRLLTEDVLAEFAISGEPDEIGPLLMQRYGNLIDRYELNTIGLPDLELAAQVARSVQLAATPILEEKQ